MNRLRMFLFVLLSGIHFYSQAQNFGLGASALYNLQTESFGAGVRGVIFPNRTISLSPQVSYFFPFNKVNEYTAGLSIEAKCVRTRLFNIYGLAHGGYNRWINAASSPLKNASLDNWNAEGGIGVSGQKCLRFFAEYRYNIRFRETHLNVGLLYIFGCNGKSGYKPKSRSSANDCPAFR